MYEKKYPEKGCRLIPDMKSNFLALKLDAYFFREINIMN